MSLRDYQVECIESMNSHEEGGIIILPTGAGKTVIFSSYVNSLDEDSRCIIVVDQDTLYEQTVDKLVIWGIPIEDIGRVQGNYKDYNKRVIVATRQSLTRNKKRAEAILEYGEIHTVIIDECHLAVKQQVLIKEMLHPKKLFGFTATPFTKQLNALYTDCIYEKDIYFMIDNGYLVEPVTIAVKSNLDLSKVKTNSDTGDFNEKQLSSTINTGTRNRIVVEAYKKYAMSRKQCIIFCASIQHAKSLSKKFKEVGIDAPALHSQLDNADELIKDFREGRIKVICNVMILTKGFDCPSVDSVIMASPTKSKNTYFQRMGRGLRLDEGKDDCLIIDITDSYKNTNALMDSSKIFNTLNGEKYSEMVERVKQEELKKQLIEKYKKGLNLTEDEQIMAEYIFDKEELEKLMMEDEEDEEEEDVSIYGKKVNLRDFMNKESDFEFDDEILNNYDITEEELYKISEEIGIEPIVLQMGIEKSNKNNYNWLQMVSNQYKVAYLQVDFNNNAYFIINEDGGLKGGRCYKYNPEEKKAELLYETKSHIIILKALCEIKLKQQYPMQEQRKLTSKAYYKSLNTIEATFKQKETIKRYYKKVVKTKREAVEHFMKEKLNTAIKKLH